MEKNTVQTSVLIKNPDITITSVASYRNFVFVSAYGGKLYIYTIRKENGNTSISDPRIIENYFPSKSSADEMIIDSVHELLIARTSKGVSCADINNLNNKTLLANTEKCTCMALKVDCSKLCIGVRKKTLVYAYRSGYRFVNYIPSKETPRCMEFIGDILAVGCKIAYYLQDIESLSITKTLLTKCSKSNTYSLSIAMSFNPEILALDSDNTIRMFDKQGSPLHSDEELIAITTQPTQLISLFPYLFVLVKNFVYVYNIVSLKRIQRIPLEGKFCIVPNDDMTTSAFLLHSTHNIYTLGLLSPENQIDLLLATNPPSFEQAIAVAVNHDLPAEVTQSLHCRYGYYLFSQSLFDEAIQHFTESECDIHNVLQLYKELLLPTLPSATVLPNEYPLPALTPVSRRRAYEAFVTYLQSVRERLLSTSCNLMDSCFSTDSISTQQDILSILDTSLVFTWISLQAADALKSFLLDKNYCNVQMVEERLVESIQVAMTEKSRFLFSFALLYLFEGRHQFKRAVEVVLFQLQQYRSASPERTQLLEILTHVLYGLDSNDESLVFKCSEKIYEEQPSLVLRCFVDDDGMIGHLNIYHVVQHLQALTAKEPSVYQQNQLALAYLKVVVPHCAALSSDRNDFNLSQKLITLYIDSIKDLLAQPDLPDQPTQIATLQQELHHLLKTNSLYAPPLVLELLPEDSLLHERCTVYSKMHCHHEALRLLLFTLEDCEGAYAYCQENYASLHKEDKRVFEIMLQTLLEPQEGDKPELVEQYAKEAFVLIDRYHSYLDAEVVLNLFPDSTPFHELFLYTSQAITELTEQMYNTRMKYNLTMSDYLESQHHVAKTRQNGVEVNETSLCAKCGKPLGTAALVRISDTELYHYTCCEVEGAYLLLKDKRTGMIEKVSISHSAI